ncbi:hypothetical protein LXD69_09505 [Flavobacterium sediminilitoris]|uniref:Lipoprotein n=1 Tax=Flavobacterium sediminilitoris TaxID=2024526 RepID=A0ABY4HHT1_9FLAO|nr:MULTISPECIES: hypothetical protein [Flavobacterium]UOX32290.1 hypothetical protein LXD69_09505 [Flavobacterium sediminilitoris]
MKCLFCILSLIIFLSCTKRDLVSNKEINFATFTIKVPFSWKKYQAKGIDSEIYYLITQENDTILVEIGKYINDFDDVLNVSNLSEYDKLDSLGFPVKEMYFSETPEIDKNQGVFHKEFYYYDTINNNIGKIKEPKFIGKGVTAILFKTPNSGENVLISAKNLDLTSHKCLLDSFKTIQWK